MWFVTSYLNMKYLYTGDALCIFVYSLNLQNGDDIWHHYEDHCYHNPYLQMNFVDALDHCHNFSNSSDQNSLLDKENVVNVTAFWRTNISAHDRFMTPLWSNKGSFIILYPHLIAFAIFIVFTLDNNYHLMRSAQIEVGATKSSENKF